MKGHTVDNGIPLSIFPISQNKLCLCVCGLPARGKTDISRRLARYLSFFHALQVKTFDVAEYRRKRSEGSRLPVYEEANLSHREACYDEAIADMAVFLSNHEDGVAILDAVSTTHQWRLKIKTEVQKMGVKLVFIEVQNNDPEFLDTQIKLVAARSPDYKVKNE